MGWNSVDDSAVAIVQVSVEKYTNPGSVRGTDSSVDLLLRWGIAIPDRFFQSRDSPLGIL